MLDIIVPVYNEVDNIQKLFDSIQEEIKAQKNVLVVYDMEEDNTLPVIRKIKDSYSFQIQMMKNQYGGGALNAILTGLKSARCDAMLVCMADCSDSLNVADKMSELITAGYDVVCGSRYMKGGKQHGGLTLKSLFSRAAGITLWLLTGLPTHDATNSFKMYSKRLIEGVEIESRGGFEIGIELVVKAYTGGFRVTEVPAQWFDRQNGKSNFHMWRWLPGYLHWYFYCIRHTWFSVRTKMV